MVNTDTLPSKHAIRVEPIIANELKAKASAAMKAKKRKKKGETKKREG